MAKIRRLEDINFKLKEKIKVAAYARVSEATDMTHKSLSAQVNHYKKLIQSNSEWMYAGVYADEGITGTSTKHRNEFNRLIKDCKDGKVDMILVKSISRFARDTVDCLNTVRDLKALSIAVYFEREKINSLTSEGELLLTLLASFAQEESRSISQNIKWGIKKKFEEGIQNGYKEPYGYRWDGEKYRIIPEKGKIVREIYDRYFDGESAYAIAKDLANRGITGQQGRPMEQTTVKDILSSISYTGVMLLQKYFQTEEGVRKTNKGELPMYMVEDMFEPIITQKEHERALAIRKQRADKMPNKNPTLTAFSGLLKCGRCGCGISRRTVAGKEKRWVCNTRERKGVDECDSRPISEKELILEADKVMESKVWTKEEFKNKVEKIMVYGDRLEFVLKNKKLKLIKRVYTGKRGSNPYTNKIFCEHCGEKMIRANSSRHSKAWYCTGKDNRALKEKELIEASVYFFAEEYQGKIVEYVDKIEVGGDTVEFKLRDGGVKVWQRK